MAAAEKKARKNRKGISADRLANGARLNVLGRHLGQDLRRFRDPGKVKGAISSDATKTGDPNQIEQDEVVRYKI